MRLSFDLGIGGLARGAPGDPLVQFPADLRAWYRGDTRVVTGSGVSQWTDKTANGLHVTQGTDAARPPAVAADTRFGSRPSVEPDGTADFLAAAAAADWAFLHNGVGCTVFAVFYSLAGTTGTRVLLDTLNGTGANVGFEIFLNATNQNITTQIANGGVNVIAHTSSNGTVVNGAAHVYCMAYGEGVAPNEYEIRLDRAQLTAGNSAAAPSASAPFGPLTVGRFTTAASGFFRGPFAEIALLNRRLSTAEMQQLEAYALSYYGV